MRCSCGKEGTIWLPRRDIPYCRDCFEHFIASRIRAETQGPVTLKQQQGYFLSAAQEACKLAQREVHFSPEGKIPGCAETAAGAKIRYLLGHTDVNEEHFPKTITLQELQTFFKPEQPVILDALTQELIAFDAAYPGTIQSIVKHTDGTQQQR